MAEFSEHGLEIVLLQLSRIADALEEIAEKLSD